MTDIIARAQELATNGHEPGPWGAFSYDEHGERGDGSYGIKSHGGEYLGIMHGPHADVTAFAPDAVAALAQDTWMYSFEYVSADTDRWTLWEWEGEEWFKSAYDAKKRAKRLDFIGKFRIVRRRVSSPEVVE